MEMVCSFGEQRARDNGEGREQRQRRGETLGLAGDLIVDVQLRSDGFETIMRDVM